MKPTLLTTLAGVLLYSQAAHSALAPLASSYCTGWAQTHNACVEDSTVGSTPNHAGEVTKLSDPYGQLTLRLRAPAMPSTNVPPDITLWASDALEQIHIQAGMYKQLGIFNTIIPSNSYGNLITSSGVKIPVGADTSDTAAPLATWDLTINSANYTQYCTGLTRCTISLTPTPAQAQAITDWIATGYYTTGTINWDTHRITTDAVVNAWYIDSSNINQRHLSFHDTLNPPAIGGGCDITPHSGFAFPIISVLIVLVLAAKRRRVVMVTLLLLSTTTTTTTHASNIMVVGDTLATTLETAAANDTLDSAISSMQALYHITSGMTEGQTVMNGTLQPDGSCSFPKKLTFFASNSSQGVSMVRTSPYQLNIDSNCSMWISYPPPDEETSDEGTPVDPVVYSDGGCFSTGQCPSPAQCARPYDVYIKTIDAALWSDYGLPFPLGLGTAPPWWTSSFRTPATKLGLSGSTWDFGPWPMPDNGGGGLGTTGINETPEFNHTVYAFSPYGWTAEPGPPGLPPLTPWQHSQTLTRHYSEAIQYFSMHSNFWTQNFFPVTQGFWHQMKIAVWLSPAGVIDLEAAFSGIMPNWGSDLTHTPPILPASFTITGNSVFGFYGVCPFSVIFPFIQQSCGENCFIYQDHL